MTLGMIWTIILRFAIQDISVEGNVVCYLDSKYYSYHGYCSNVTMVTIVMWPHSSSALSLLKHHLATF